jgi:hypothetical protein
LFPLFATGFVDTSGKFAIGINNTSGTGGTAGAVNIGGARKYLRDFSKKFEITLTLFSGGKMKARLIQLAICLMTCLTWSLPAPQQGVRIKGTVPRDFRLQVFSWISFCQEPEYPIRAVSNFCEN